VLFFGDTILDPWAAMRVLLGEEGFE